MSSHPLPPNAAWVAELAKELGCTRLLALSYIPREKLIRAVGNAGLEKESRSSWRWNVSDFPLVERALKTQEIQALPAADFPPEIASYFSGTVVCLPLLREDRPFAALVGQMETGVLPRTPAWRLRAQEVAARASLWVQLEQTTADYQDEVQVRFAAREVVAAILEGRPLSEIADLILEQVALRLQEDRMALYLQEASGEVGAVSWRQMSQEYAEEAARLMPRSPLLARARATDLPYYARDVQNDPQVTAERRALFQRENISSILIGWLQFAAQVTGVLAVYPQGSREFTPAEIAVFQSFSDLATLAVALSRQITQQRDVAMMEERNRLAREIHDTVAQSLALLTLQLETVQNLFQSGRAEDAEALLSAARTLARTALEETRRAVQDLAPTSLEHLDPAYAIEQETQRFEAETNLPAPFIRTGEEQPLNPDQRTALLRIAQESLSNARKHAQAKRVRVGLQFGKEDVTLIVEDDGLGFDAENRPQPGAEGGYGLFGMEERARLLGGELKIESTPGWGTRVLARLPLRPASTLPSSPPSAERGHRPEKETLPVAVPADPSAIRLLLADDHAITRQGLKTMLESRGEFVVIGEATDGGQAAEQAQRLRPDVVLMDVQMPGTDGLEGLRRIHAALPQLPVIILTTFQNAETVRAALQGGASGYLLKDTQPNDLMAAIRAAHRGESLFSAAVREQLRTLATGQDEGDPLTRLTDREHEVLQHLARGARNKEIAAALVMAPKTLEYHLTNIFQKLGVSNRTEATRLALERGLV